MIMYMSHTLIDVYNNILEYNNSKINIIFDNSNTLWFSAIGVASALAYDDTNRAIDMHVSDEYKKQFSELKKFVKNIPKNSQPHAIYINEFGLYQFLFESRQPLAEDFRQWVIEKVIPSIKNTGSYKIEEKYKKKLDKLNIKLEQNNTKLSKSKKEIRILKHNQKRKHYKAKGLVYILRPIDSRNKKLIKLGKTVDFDKRLQTYKTSVPDDMEVLFQIEVKNPYAVEKCAKGIADKFIYRENKEYYECNIKTLKNIILSCDKLVSNPKDISQFIATHNIKANDKLYLDIVPNQTGGDESDNEFINILSKNDMDDILLQIPIDDISIANDYCNDKLYPYFNSSNKMFFECGINELKNLLDICGSFEDTDSELNMLTGDLIIDIPGIEQVAGSNPMTDDEFHKAIQVMDGGGFILPNGVIVYPDGRVVYPKK